MKQSKENRIFQLEKTTHLALSKLDPKQTLVVATLSPIEVHGPHLPLGQDYFEAYTLAEHAVSILSQRHEDWSFILLPPFPIATDCVPQFGSVTFPVQVVRDVAYHALEPFAKRGFARLLYSSFHGGPRHVCALESAAQSLTEKYNVPTASLFSMVLSRVLEGNVFYEAICENTECNITVEQLKKDHHAGFVETSLALHCWPELIEQGWEELEPLVSEGPKESGANDSFLYGYQEKPGVLDRAKRNVAQFQSIIKSIRHFNDHTFYGYPSLASESQGKDLLEYLSILAADTTDQFIEQGLKTDVHSPLWKLRHLLLNRGVNKVVNDWLKF